MVDVIFPKFGLPNVTFGLPSSTLLNRLNTSHRNSTCLPAPVATIVTSAGLARARG